MLQASANYAKATLASTVNYFEHSGYFSSLHLAYSASASCANLLVHMMLTIAAALQHPLGGVFRLGSRAIEYLAFYGSMLFLSGRLIMLRRTLTTNGKLTVGLFTAYCLRPTILIVIECSKVNYRTTRAIRRFSLRATHLLQMMLVLPLSFLQMFNLFTIMFDTFFAVFQVFFKVIEIGFTYAILIFKTYKTFVLCCAAIMKSMYITAFYSILLVHSALACLTAFTAMLQHNTIRQALISYKEHKKRVARGSSQM